MPGRLYPPSRIEKEKKSALQGPLCLHFRANPSRAHTHTAAVKKLGCPWRLVKAERLTGAAGGVGRKRSCCQSASAAIQGDHRLSQKTFQPLQLNATAFCGGSATGQPRVTRPRQKHSDLSLPPPPDTAAPKVGDLLVVKTQSVDSCLLASPPSQGRVGGRGVGYEWVFRCTGWRDESWGDNRNHFQWD